MEDLTTDEVQAKIINDKAIAILEIFNGLSQNERARVQSKVDFYLNVASLDLSKVIEVWKS